MPVTSQVMRPVIQAFGSNGSGQLGISHLDDTSNPTLCTWADGISPAGIIRSVNSGGNHTLVLFEDGRLFGTGANNHAQICNDNSSSSISSFRQITAKHGKDVIDRFAFTSATWEATTLVTGGGAVLTQGGGLKGELGHGSEHEVLQTAKQLTSFPPPGATIVDLNACMSHTVAILSNGDVYGWGNGRKGQLGLPAEIVWEPRKIELPFKACKAACGRDFTFLASGPEDGRFTVLGSDKHLVVSSAPPSITGWSHLAASWCSMHVLVREELLSWGRSDHGQLLGKQIPDIETFAVGSEHGLAKSRDGRVLAWGWGEHGNCGSDAAEDVIHQITRIDGPCVLGAGCATSFIASDR